MFLWLFPYNFRIFESKARFHHESIGSVLIRRRICTWYDNFRHEVDDRFIQVCRREETKLNCSGKGKEVMFSSQTLRNAVRPHDHDGCTFQILTCHLSRLVCYRGFGSYPLYRRDND